MVRRGRLPPAVFQDFSVTMKYGFNRITPGEMFSQAAALPHRYPPSPTERLAFFFFFSFLWAAPRSFLNDQIGFKVNRNIAYEKPNHVLELTSDII